MALISLNAVSIKPVPGFLKAGFYVTPFTNTQRLSSSARVLAVVSRRRRGLRGSAQTPL